MIEEQNNIPTTENFIMDYNLIDIIPLEPEKTNFIISIIIKLIIKLIIKIIMRILQIRINIL